jgi:hypothetical protein
MKLTQFSLIFCLLCFACTRQALAPRTPAGISGPRCIVYKTRADYNHLVPVILSPDKSGIVSFPDVKDIYFNDSLAYPTLLNEGYLLDNRGISPDVAFLKITYEEYGRLVSTPSGTELLRMILDKDPLAEMYDCGNRNQYQDPAGTMNRLIITGELARQKRLK